ncbi:MAG: hypothetical protein ACRD6Q_01485 [Nitrososphaeraceae archaeon]
MVRVQPDPPIKLGELQEYACNSFLLFNKCNQFVTAFPPRRRVVTWMPGTIRALGKDRGQESDRRQRQKEGTSFRAAKFLTSYSQTLLFCRLPFGLKI